MTGTAEKIISWLAPVAYDKERLYEIREYRSKRTRSQNSYYWALLGEVSRKLRVPAAEIHNRMLRDVSGPEEFGGKKAFLLLPDNEETERKALLSETVHLRPTSQTKVLADGITYRTYVLLKGSHSMSTDEMAALLDNLISEAKQIGVETLPPHELERMREYERRRHA